MPIDTLLPQAPGPGRLVDKRMTTQEITGRVRGGQLAGRRQGVRGRHELSLGSGLWLSSPCTGLSGAHCSSPSLTPAEGREQARLPQ